MGIADERSDNEEDRALSALSADLSAVVHCAKAEAPGEGGSYTGWFLKPVLNGIWVWQATNGRRTDRRAE